MSKLPKLLYHGAVEQRDSLNPTVEVDDREAFEDEPKPVRYLFTSTSDKVAVEKGLEAALRKTHKVKEIIFSEKEVRISLEMDSPPLTNIQFDRLRFWLYTIRPMPNDGWVQDDFPTCWKTPKKITTISSRLPCSASRYIASKKLTIIHPRF